MGANNSSTRKLTVVNDDPTSMIKVSDEVVQRIKNTQDSRPTAETIQPQHVPISSPVIYEPTVTTLQLRQNNASELKKNDEYWQNRLKNLQNTHKKINEVMEEEYIKAVEELEGNKRTSDLPAKYLPPCQDSKEAVMKCYSQHTNEPIKCAKVVQEFQKCVDLKRAALIANRG